MVAFFCRAVRDARCDPFFPAPWYVAPFWVIWKWRALRRMYREMGWED